MSRSKSRSGYLEFGQKKHSSFLLRTISGSKFCRGDALASQVDKEALVSVDRNSASLSENRIVKAAMLQKQIGNLEEQLKNAKERLDEVETERDRLIAEVREAKELVNAGLSPAKAEQVFSEVKRLTDSLSNSKKEIESRDKHIRLLNNRVESAKLFEIELAERDGSLEELQKRILELENQVEKRKQSESKLLESLTFQTRQIEQSKIDLEESKLEVVTLNQKLKKLGQYGENELNSSLDTKALKDEITKLRHELKLATEAEEKSKKAMDDLASALREVATEASTAKEKLKSSEEHEIHLREEIKRLNEELELQTNTSNRLKLEAEESVLAWTAKELGFISCIRNADEENASLKHTNHKLTDETTKLRDILKQALNESSVAKESSNIAQAENAELKDLLAEKEASLRFLMKENQRLRTNEVESHEPCNQEQSDVFASPVSSLYEDHYKVFKMEEDDNKFDQENHAAEKAELLQGSVFYTVLPGTEPRTPETKAGVRGDGTGYADSSGSSQAEDVENNVTGGSGSVNHKEDSEDKGFNMYGLYSRQKLLRKIGELVTGSSNGVKDGSTEQR